MSDWTEFYDKRRNRSAFQDKVQEIVDGSGGDRVPDLKLVSQDHYTFGNYEFDAVGVSGARELAAAYAIYVKRATVAGDDVDPFERPTKDGWA